jgi:serine/threonine protein kinase
MPPPLDAIDEDINQMIFPGVDKKYTYNPKHFRYIDIIESSRHIVKEFIFDPLKLPMAVKTIRMPQNRYQEHENENDVKKLKLEVKSFRQLSHHPNIVNFYGLCFNDEEAMICMELMDLSLYDLYLVVHEQKEKFPENILGYITVKCLDALGFCKKHNLIHRDVKPKNILLNNQGEVKLCDFGESRILKGMANI